MSPLRKPLIAAAIALIAAALIPAAASARSVYVGDLNGSQIRALTQDPATGVLAPGTSVAGGTAPVGLAMTPDGKNLYNADYSTGEIRGYSVAPDGSLTPKAGSPFSTAGPANAITVTADGKYLYAANGGPVNKVSGYAIGTDGALTPLPGSPYNAPAADNLFGIASSPDSKLLYVTTQSGPDRLLGYSIGADGALAPLPAALPSPGTRSEGIVFSPDGKRLYVARNDDDQVAAFNVDASGALTPVAGSPFTVGDQPYGLAMAPNGKNLYVAAFNANNVESYPVSADGALGAANGTAPAGAGPSAIAVSSDSRFIYSGASADPTGFGFSVAETGALTGLAGSPYLIANASDFQGVTITPNQGPKANLKVIPQGPGVKEKVQFKGDDSTDSDRSVVSYVYDFGDGDSKTGTAEKPKVSHKYKKTGTFTVTLTVTDNEGCSTTTVYTGQTASCNGGPAAVTTKQITVTDKEIDKPKLKARGTQKQSGKTVKIEIKAGAKEKVTIVGTGKLKIKGKGEQALLKSKKNVKANSDKTLKLKLKRESANKKVFKALKAGKPVKARVKVKFVDEAGTQLVQKVPTILLKK